MKAVHILKLAAVGLAATSTFLPADAAAQTREDDERELRRLHAELIQAHLDGRLEDWLAAESADYVSINGGRVTLPTMEERRERRGEYLANAMFSRYEDVREPILRVSADGSLAWLIAEVQVEGTLRTEEGTKQTFGEVWAWVELYEHTADGWKLVGNASNSRALDPGDAHR